jgi:protein involved in plasmid replication-relaxation
MSSETRGWQIKPRDLAMLAALDYGPLTGRQLEKLSGTWAEPFPSDRMARERLQRMAEAKLVRPYNYAVVRSIKPENYYVPTRRGYQLVHGPDSEPPTKGYCSPIALVRQFHQQALSDFVVHTVLGAHRSYVQLTGFRRENSIRLDAAGRTVYPDSSFLLTNRNEHFRFFVELDTGSERMRSDKDTDSIERKLRTYDAFQALKPGARFRVLFVCVQSSRDRMLHILETAARVISDANRTLFYGITLTDYLTTLYPVTSPRFLDHRGGQHSLVPDVKASSLLAPAVLRPARKA